MSGQGRAAVTVGLASLVSAVFVATHGDPWQLVTMTGATAVVAVVLGVLACLAGWAGRGRLISAVGVAFCLAALVLLVELGSAADWLGGSASTLSLWLGLGAGMVAVGRADSRPADSRPAGSGLAGSRPG